MASELTKDVDFRLAFDALSDDRQSQVVGKDGQRMDQRAVCLLVSMSTSSERSIFSTSAGNSCSDANDDSRYRNRQLPARSPDL